MRTAYCREISSRVPYEGCFILASAAKVLDHVGQPPRQRRGNCHRECVWQVSKDRAAQAGGMHAPCPRLSAVRTSRSRHGLLRGDL
jgi:hypothetical protein